MEVVFETDNKDDEPTQRHAQQLCKIQYPFQCAPLRAVAIKSSRVLVPGGEGIKRVVEITLDLTDHADLRNFQPGDTVGILPRNHHDDIEKLLTAMQLTDKAHTVCRVTHQDNASAKPKKPPQHIPFAASVTPHELLRDILNVRAVLKKQFLRSLAASCSQPGDCELLCELASREGAARYNELILEKGTQLPHLLHTLAPSCQPTLPQLLEHLPQLLPRPYSIANCGRLHPQAEHSDNEDIETAANEIRLIFSIRTGEESAGLTTGMLDQLVAGNDPLTSPSVSAPPSVFMYLRQPTTFRFTATEAQCHNQLLIAIGTGVAPFIGFLELKAALLQRAVKEEEPPLGATWLVVGATATSNLPHRQRLLEWHESGGGVLQRYHECFSRAPGEDVVEKEGEAHAEKQGEAPPAAGHYRYVQEQILAHSAAIVEFLMLSDTLLYVCADGAAISRSIDAALAECLQQQTDKSADECAAMLKVFQRSGKYRQDVWL